jgi:hypothetical protein
MRWHVGFSGSEGPPGIAPLCTAPHPPPSPLGEGSYNTALEHPHGLLSICMLADHHLGTITGLEVLQHPSINL